jgi:hypothetical protein
MARRKKPENETEEEIKHRRLLEVISNFSTRSEKTSWNRKMDNMVKLMSKLNEIDQRILEITAKEKQPILDEVSVLRMTMVKECIHPFEQLVLHENHVRCKFCNHNMSMVFKNGPSA